MARARAGGGKRAHVLSLVSSGIGLRSCNPSTGLIIGGFRGP